MDGQHKLQAHMFALHRPIERPCSGRSVRPHNAFLLHLETRCTERNEGGSFIGGSFAEWASHNNEIKIIFLISPVTRRPQMGVIEPKEH